MFIKKIGAIFSCANCVCEIISTSQWCLENNQNKYWSDLEAQPNNMKDFANIQVVDEQIQNGY